ncbi:PREDICTED: PX domain-containing protein 1 [Thamnophis sirtalis]|uniref:PX domain-containing protein 1 n=1 Tax=Thamnophis sirtalis TaxID=35019 RepID=A0A6I9Y735_9SAUR|nr:PREDICTED: PX domain-containing protein 1 [Thamnophis sirtalis]
MASAVFEGTSLVNMFVRGCWVNGIRRLIVNRRGDEEEFFEIRTEWSDRNVLYLHRSYSDLGRLFKRLLDSFPEDRPELSQSPFLQGLPAASFTDFLPLPPPLPNSILCPLGDWSLRREEVPCKGAALPSRRS